MCFASYACSDQSVFWDELKERRNSFCLHEYWVEFFKVDIIEGNREGRCIRDVWDLGAFWESMDNNFY